MQSGPRRVEVPRFVASGHGEHVWQCAHLEGAVLIGAHLTFYASLAGADLRDADLSRADLSSARNLTKEQLEQACGTDAKLPLGFAGFALKPCPAPPSPPTAPRP